MRSSDLASLSCDLALDATTLGIKVCKCGERLLNLRRYKLAYQEAHGAILDWCYVGLC